MIDFHKLKNGDKDKTLPFPSAGLERRNGLLFITDLTAEAE